MCDYAGRVEELGVERIFGRPITLFQLAEWTWDPTWEPSTSVAFTLVVAAHASTRNELEEIVIRRFAREAVAAGCGYVCTWGPGCESVHDLFDVEAIAADRFVMSTWHDDWPLHDVLYFALTQAIPEDVLVAGNSPIVLAIEEAWVADVRRLIADQDELARL